MDISQILAFLENSAVELKDAAHSAGSDSKVSGQDPVGWNAVQCVEHVGLVEERFLAMVRNAGKGDGTASAASPRNEQNEAKVYAMAASRNVKVAARNRRILWTVFKL